MKTSGQPLKRWKVEDVSSWLTSIGMKAYVPTFRKQNITGKHLKYFTENDLITQCKITARPVRKILFKRLKHLQQIHSSSAGPAGNDWSDSSEEEEEEEEETQEEVPEEPVEPQVVRDEPEVDTQPDPPMPEMEEEEKPRFTPDEASFAIQGLYRCKKAHQRVVQMIREQYIKVYSLATGRFMYKYIGKICQSDNHDGEEEEEPRRCFSKLMKDMYTFHTKPVNLHRGEDLLDVTFTPELATMRIQKFTRYCYALKVTRALIRKNHRRIFDHINGQFFYYNPRTTNKGWCKPKLLGKEPWDPMDMTSWSKDDVRLYFRRRGLRRHAIMGEIERFDIDGPMLLSLDKNDFDRFQVPEKSLKPMLRDLENMESSAQHLHNSSDDTDCNDKKCDSHEQEKFDPEVLERRNRLRSHCEFIRSASLIQKNVRRYLYVKKTEAMHKLVQYYHGLEQKRKHEGLEHWWSDQAPNYLVLSSGEYGGDLMENMESRTRREIPILKTGVAI